MKGWLKGVLKQSEGDPHPASAPSSTSSTINSSITVSGSGSSPTATTSSNAGSTTTTAAAEVTVSPPPPASSSLTPPVVSSSLPPLRPSRDGSPASNAAVSPPGVSAPLSPLGSAVPHTSNVPSIIDYPTHLSATQKLISTFLSKSKSDRHHQVELVNAVVNLCQHPMYDPAKLGHDGVKLVTKLSDVVVKSIKENTQSHGSRTQQSLHTAMTHPHHDAGDIDGLTALKVLYYLVGGSAIKQTSSSKTTHAHPSTDTFHTGITAAVKAHLPSALVDMVLASANIQINVSVSGSGSVVSSSSLGGSALGAGFLKKSSSMLPSPSHQPHTPPVLKSSGSTVSASSGKSYAALMEAEYHAFSLLALFCTHDHTATEELLAQHKIEILCHLTVLIISSAAGVGNDPGGSVSSVFNSNLVRLMRVISKSQAKVKGVTKAAQETGMITLLTSMMSKKETQPPNTEDAGDEHKETPDTTSLTRQVSSTPYQVAFDCFDLVTSWVIDAASHSLSLLDDFVESNGYSSIQSFVLRFSEESEAHQHTRVVVKRLSGLLLVGHGELVAEPEVLPFNLPAPSSRSAAAGAINATSLSPASSTAVKQKPPLSYVLSSQPSLLDTHKHLLGFLPHNPSVARVRGHARTQSAKFPPAAFLHTTPAPPPHSRSSSVSNLTAASFTHTSSSTANNVRNLEVVQLIRDIFIHTTSSLLQLQLLHSLEFIFMSSQQLQLISSTNFIALLLKSLPAFTAPVQNALLYCLQLMISYNHNDYIPFKELCALSVTLIADLTAVSLPSILAVVISLHTMIEYDPLRYQHLLREAGVLDVLITNLNVWYTQFAIAYDKHYDPLSSTASTDQSVTASGANSPSSAFSPRAEALTSIMQQGEQQRKRMLGRSTSAISPQYTVSANDDEPIPIPVISPKSPLSLGGKEPPDQPSLSLTHLVRIVNATLDLLAIMLRGNTNNQELFSTTTAPVVVLSFSVYPPVATPALHLIELLLQAHYQRLEAMSPSPRSTIAKKELREQQELTKSISIGGMMTTTSTAPQTIPALQLLGDAYMLCLLHLLFASLPLKAFQFPFYRAPPADASLAMKPAHLSLATHPDFQSFFPVPSVTSALSISSILRASRLLYVVRRALSSSYCAQQSFGRMRGFERVCVLLKGFNIHQISISTGNTLTNHNNHTTDSTSPAMKQLQREDSTGGVDAVSPTPPTVAHSACLFFMQEVLLTVLLGMKGNDRNSHYPYPSPLPSHYHLMEQPVTAGFHTVGYRCLCRLLLRVGVCCDALMGPLPGCTDLICNWLFWLALEFLPTDEELVSTSALPCMLSPQQRDQQERIELAEEEEQLQQVLKGVDYPDRVVSLTSRPPAAASLKITTVQESPALEYWWEHTETDVQFTLIAVNKLLLTTGTVYHPIALRLVIRFLSCSSIFLHRRLLNLLTLVTRSNAINAIALGQADVLGPLTAFFRPVLLNINDPRYSSLLDVIHQLLPF